MQKKALELEQLSNNELRERSLELSKITSEIIALDNSANTSDSDTMIQKRDVALTQLSIQRILIESQEATEARRTARRLRKQVRKERRDRDILEQQVLPTPEPLISLTPPPRKKAKLIPVATSSSTPISKTVFLETKEEADDSTSVSSEVSSIESKICEDITFIQATGIGVAISNPSSQADSLGHPGRDETESSFLLVWDEILRQMPLAKGQPVSVEEEVQGVWIMGTIPKKRASRPKLKTVPILRKAFSNVESRMKKEIEKGKPFTINPLP